MKEKVFKLNININSLYWYEYLEDLNVEEAKNKITAVIKDLLSKDGRLDIMNIDISII